MKLFSIILWEYETLKENVVPNDFTERWWGTKCFSMFKMGYKIVFNYVKLFSALVSRIENDCSLTLS